MPLFLQGKRVKLLSTRAAGSQLSIAKSIGTCLLATKAFVANQSWHASRARICDPAIATRARVKFAQLEALKPGKVRKSPPIFSWSFVSEARQTLTSAFVVGWKLSRLRVPTGSFLCSRKVTVRNWLGRTIPRRAFFRGTHPTMEARRSLVARRVLEAEDLK